MKSNLDSFVTQQQNDCLKSCYLSQPGSDKKRISFHFAELFGGAGIATE